MIERKRGDILREDVEALVNTVNCVGAMGRGVALQFKKQFPANYRAYAAACRRGEVRLGSMFVFDRGSLRMPRIIINFPTKHHWRSKSRLSDIEAGLEDLIRVIRGYGIRSIAVPPLGSGLGGLPWSRVESLIKERLGGIVDLDVVLFLPGSGPSKTHVTSGATLPMTSAGAVLVGLMRRYMRAVLDPHLTLLEVHKLMYFMQEAAEPLRLRFNKGPYGPYADNLRHLLVRMEGHFLTGYADGEDNPRKPLAVLPEAAEQATSCLDGLPETRERFNRVVDLIEGFESAFGLELLSTVHWVMTREGVEDTDDLVDKVYAWNERKRQFTRWQIGIAAQTLAAKGWSG